jgi:hypothetical protein
MRGQKAVYISDKRQTHPLVREGATPKDKTEIVKK